MPSLTPSAVSSTFTTACNAPMSPVDIGRNRSVFIIIIIYLLKAFKRK